MWGNGHCNTHGSLASLYFSPSFLLTSAANRFCSSSSFQWHPTPLIMITEHLINILSLSLPFFFSRPSSLSVFFIPILKRAEGVEILSPWENKTRLTFIETCLIWRTYFATCWKEAGQADRMWSIYYGMLRGYFLFYNHLCHLSRELIHWMWEVLCKAM
jgi:hypothetical protein